MSDNFPAGKLAADSYNSGIVTTVKDAATRGWQWIALQKEDAGQAEAYVRTPPRYSIFLCRMAARQD
jgi:hypothetical protein